MSFFSRSRCFALVVACSLSAAAVLPPFARADGPAATQPRRAEKEIVADFQSQMPALVKALQGREFADADTRRSMSGEAVPALRKVIATLGEMEAVMPKQAVKIKNQIASYKGLLYALDDSSTVAQTDTAAKDLDAADGRAARVVQLRSDWIKAPAKDAAGRGAVVNALQKLDEAHPEDELLAITTFTFFQQTAEPAQKKQLQTLLTDTLKNPLSAQFADYFKNLAARQQAAASAADKLKGLEGKPLDVAGPTVDGKTFSTSTWKGKVVLVDFWATWCGPCMAELPRVKEMYAKYHDKGLEVLGVSNDYEAGALKSYLASSKMPWPQLFDAQAAEKEMFNPTTLGLGIEAIPVMVLIDKTGNCRTVAARESMEALIPQMLAE